VAGALGAGTATSLEDILKGALTGAKSGLEKADFRDVSFNLGGTIEKPSVSNVKIAPAPQAIQQTTPSGTAPTAVEEATAPPKEATGETQKKPENLLEGVIQEGLKNILKKE
jgi:translocation and assembly module TamB